MGRRAGRHLVNPYGPWRAVTAEAGVPGLRIHDLRHNFATTGARNGLTLALVGALLGHSDPDTTRRYVNFVTDDPLRERVEQVAASIATALGLAPEPLPAGRGPGRELSEEQVNAVLADTRSATHLAAKLGVSISLVTQIRKGKK